MPLRISAWSSASRILIKTVPARGVRRAPGSRRRPVVRPGAGRRAGRAAQQADTARKAVLQQ